MNSLQVITAIVGRDSGQGCTDKPSAYEVPASSWLYGGVWEIPQAHSLTKPSVSSPQIGTHDIRR